MIVGRYRIEAWIDQGGAASLARATHMDTGRACLLKVVDPQLAARWEFVDLLFREAKVGALIGAHPCIANVLEADVDRVKGSPYLAIEPIEGEPLDRQLLAFGPMPPDLLVTIFKQLAEALGQAHGVGVIHRGLKPASVFLTWTPEVKPVIKVVDFGIARILEDEARQLAMKGGSPAYAAPEQLGPALRRLAAASGITIAARVSPATDVWALGLLAFELLTGVSAAQYWGHGSAAKVEDLIGSIALEEPRPASQRAGDRAHLLPVGFDAWLARCLRKNSAHRWSTAAEAVSELSPLLEHGIVNESTGPLPPSNDFRSMPVAGALPPPTAPPPRPSSIRPLPPATTPPPRPASTRPLPPATTPPRPASVRALTEPLPPLTPLHPLPGRAFTQPLPEPTPPFSPDVHVQIQARREARRPLPRDAFDEPTRVMPMPSEAPPMAGTNVLPRPSEAPHMEADGTHAQLSRRKERLVMILGGSVLGALIALVVMVFFSPSAKEQLSSSSTSSSMTIPGSTRLTIAGSQPGVRVLVDGVDRGTLPLSLTNIEPGTHAIRFDAGDRYEKLEKFIEIEAGSVKDLGVVRLKVIRGQVAIDLAPSDATLALLQVAPNGIETRVPIANSSTQPVKLDVEGDGWQVVATKTGYKDFAQVISFDDGIAEKAIRISMIPLPEGATPPEVRTPPEPDEPRATSPASGQALLNINSIPVSKVLLDGQPLGNTPRVSVAVSPGNHTVTFIHPTKGKKSVGVTVKAGETKTASVRF